MSVSNFFKKNFRIYSRFCFLLIFQQTPLSRRVLMGRWPNELFSKIYSDTKQKTIYGQI